MPKQILTNDGARRALKEGVDTVSNIVKVTIGPYGRNIVLDKGFLSPTITNDGVSIAREIVLKDKVHNMGANIVQDVAQKTNEKVGDGTTTSIILTQSIFEEGMKHLANGVNAITLKKGITQAAEYVVKELKKLATPIKRKEEITQIATISSESEEIGKIISDTIEKIGNEGTITVEESQLAGVEAEIVDGMKINRGYVSPYMVTDYDKMITEYTDVPILITDKKLVGVREMIPLLEKIGTTGRKDLLVIAEDIEGEVLSTFILNKMKGGFNISAIKAPDFGNTKKEILQDIAILTGATVFSDETGITFSKGELEMLGTSPKVVVGKESTIIVGAKEQKEKIQSRIASLKQQKELAESKIDKNKYDERISKLSGGVAVIKVGAATESEMKYLKLKIEDAVNATKAAIEEGVVAGGGSALAKVAGEMDKLSNQSTNKELNIGFEIIKKAIVAPIKQIITNTGSEDGAFIVKQIQESKKANSGYDAFHEVMVEDMVKAGIIDPVKVTRTALENAASAAATLLTTEGVIAEEPKDINKDNK